MRQRAAKVGKCRCAIFACVGYEENERVRVSHNIGSNPIVLKLNRLNCYKYITLSGNVKHYFVKSLQTVCLLFALGVAVVSRVVHTSNIAHWPDKSRA